MLLIVVVSVGVVFSWLTWSLDSWLVSGRVCLAMCQKRKEKKGERERAFNVVTAFYQPRAQKE